MGSAQALLALAVQHILAEQGRSAAELAADIDAKPSDLSRRLSGEVPFTDRDVPRLAAGLGVTPQELVDRAVQLGSDSTRAGTAARLGLDPPAGGPVHDVQWWQDLVDEARTRASQEGPEA